MADDELAHELANNKMDGTLPAANWLDILHRAKSRPLWQHIFEELLG